MIKLLRGGSVPSITPESTYPYIYRETKQSHLLLITKTGLYTEDKMFHHALLAQNRCYKHPLTWDRTKSSSFSALHNSFCSCKSEDIQAAERDSKCSDIVRRNTNKLTSRINQHISQIVMSSSHDAPRHGLGLPGLRQLKVEGMA